MKKPHAPQVRKFLEENRFGISTKEISETLGIRSNTIYKVLDAMPDVYIDRWTGPIRGQYVAVWCLADIPENCPHPTDKALHQRKPRKPKTTWVRPKE